ncbi:peptidase C15 [Chroococcidiopsis sp. TS-821]|uniref:pyroglutamyl-peptidase I family protein n=1 Tax=Chroococcidiopsis sp. TS-821 TaxID=1378066 RepID=UPI000CEDF9FE|nr:peptidase C15 [Chroococcidiopsis sp. TS-821]PPS41571.1 peptidase C15 [Chroococcidiopsis sp. TS-821]
MPSQILLTSFTTWLPHQKSNSSDDLIAKIDELYLTNSTLQLPLLTVLRKLPVDTQQASKIVISKITEIQPTAIICCGMAESRTQLTVESHAACGDVVLRSPLDLEHLIAELSITQISHDAGKFVCEGLYFAVLDYITTQKLNSHCLFVHVPILTEDNMQKVIKDFILIIQKMALL